jgi:hypothetical protein
MRIWNVQETKNFFCWWTKSPNTSTINIPLQILNPPFFLHYWLMFANTRLLYYGVFFSHTLWRRLYCNIILLLCVSITIVIAIKCSAETGCFQPKSPEQNVKFLLHIYLRVLIKFYLISLEYAKMQTFCGPAVFYHTLLHQVSRRSHVAYNFVIIGPRPDGPIKKCL